MSAAQAPRRGQEPSEPQLRLVRRQRRERTRLVGSAALGLIFVLLFVLAACQAVLVQGQLELDRIDRAMAVREVAREKLVLQVATLESPSRIEETARQLGMVDPPDVVFLEVAPPATVSAGDGRAAVSGADVAAAAAAPPGATP
jgi:cell division protein FtsB